MGSDTPHPIGSDANATVRNRILDEFTRLGYSPQTQSAFDLRCVCVVCATVQNVVARLDGTQPGPAVLLAAHYDSVAAGPGVSDDGVGVAAVLEIARALKSLPAPLHTVIFLIDDGEEAGLLGARAFVDFHPWANEVKVAVNVDARGTSGPSLMFETGTANEWAVRLYARSIARPATSSIAYTIYKQLPNDTDFSVFKSTGYQGLNFALIGDAPVYHTPHDDMQNVNPASLQHQGDNALQSIRALANSDLSNPPESDAVFFDVFGHWTIHWASRWTLLFAALATVLIAAQIGFLLWSGGMHNHQFYWGLVTWFMQMISLTIFAYLLQRLLLLTGGAQANWVAHPVPLETAFWMLPVAVVVIHSIVFAHRAGFWGLWCGLWAWWALLSMVCAWRIPGVSYVVLAPLTAAALAGLPFTLRRIPQADAVRLNKSRLPALEKHSERVVLVVLIPLGVSAIIGFVPALLIYSALGGSAMVGLAVLIGLILTPITPLGTDLRDARGLLTVAIPGISVAVLLLAAFGAVALPAYSAKSPEHLNIDYWQDTDAESAQWIVEPDSGRLPEPLRLAAPFSRMSIGPLPWSTGPRFLASAPHLNLASPTFTTILDDSQAGSRRSLTTPCFVRSARRRSRCCCFPPALKWMTCASAAFLWRHKLSASIRR